MNRIIASKLYIVMVGLPARGKSTIATKLRENLVREHIRTRIFNNGELRRKLYPHTSHPQFYDPRNREGVSLREKIALMNIQSAVDYLRGRGQVAILDATNVSAWRREKTALLLKDRPVLFLECINEDEEILKASIERKVAIPEFQHLKKDAAVRSFRERIGYYESIYAPVETERNRVRLNSLYNKILQEEITDDIPFYDLIRDLLVADIVKNLLLIRHGETYFNLENRIGGNSGLTGRGKAQAKALARHFQNKKIPVIFTSEKKRTVQTAFEIMRQQPDCTIIPLKEFNEIDSGICEAMSYGEIREKMPHVYSARKQDKYNYVYPRGEGYASMKERVDRGIKKALYLSNNPQYLMIVGHRAVNRMILSHFLYRREEDVPYIYVPQDKFYHIVATQTKKLFQLRAYDNHPPLPV